MWIPVQSDVSLELDKYDLIGDNAIIESPINLMIMKRTPRQSLQRVNKVNRLKSWKFVQQMLEVLMKCPLR